MDFERSALPVRVRVANWDKSACKRCLVGDPPDGSIVVKRFGTGWWHDDCYRVVDPAFYVGLPELALPHLPNHVRVSRNGKKSIADWCVYLQDASTNVYDPEQQFIMYRITDGKLMANNGLAERDGVRLTHDRRDGAYDRFGLGERVAGERRRVHIDGLRALRNYLNSLDL